MNEIYKTMKKYSESDIYPFHMPGHKRRKMDIFQGKHPYEVDFTEVDGLDDLHEPEEMFRTALDRAKEFYGTKETFFLVNGSTSGIMASIAAVCQIGDTIIVGRNCHKSVAKAIELLGLHPVYVYPEYDSENGMVTEISIEAVKKAVEEHPEAKGVLIVSPTYEGVVMDILGISEITRGHQMALIVDEAHGAHFPFSEHFPKSAISLGADLVIQSLHKTMPAFTQTALLHVCTDRIEGKRVQESIQYFETTSPSYLFSASMEDAIAYGIQEKEAFEQYWRLLREFRKKAEGWKYLQLADNDDQGKLVISTAKCKMTGKQLYDILLKKYRLQMEMAQERYCLAMTSVCDTAEGYERLAQALEEIDQVCEGQETEYFTQWKVENELVMIPNMARRADTERVLVEECAGRISGEYIYLYPPGIPLVVPGERLSKEVIMKMKEYQDGELRIRGMEDSEAKWIKVIK